MKDIAEGQHVDPPRRIVAPEDQRFWAAIDAGELQIARCECGKHYARAQACLACGAKAGTMAWVPASGAATLVSFVEFDKAYHPYFESRLPYVVAVVALAEGPELVTNLVGVSSDELAAGTVSIGTPVQMRIATRAGVRIHEATVRR